MEYLAGDLSQCSCKICLSLLRHDGWWWLPGRKVVADLFRFKPQQSRDRCLRQSSFCLTGDRGVCQPQMMRGPVAMQVRWAVYTQPGLAGTWLRVTG